MPGIAKGEATAPGPGNLPLLPVSFLAIKNLVVEADWGDADIAISQKVTDFGPFKVGAKIENNKLSHAGLQIVGWMLQRMPALPPRDPSP